MKNLQVFLQKVLYPRFNFSLVLPGATYTLADEEGKSYVDFLPTPEQEERGFKEFHGFVDVKKPGIIYIINGEETVPENIIGFCARYFKTDYMRSILMIAKKHRLHITSDPHQKIQIEIELEDYTTVMNFVDYLCNLCSYTEEIAQYATDNYLDLEEGSLADKAQEINKFLQAVIMSIKNPN